MNIKNIDVISRFNELNYFSDKKLPQRISYTIVYNLDSLSRVYKVYEESLKNIFSEFDDSIQKDEDGNQLRNPNGVPIVNDDVKEEFYKEINDLLNIDIEVEMKLVSKECFDYDDTPRFDSMSPSEIIRLQKLICSDETTSE